MEVINIKNIINKIKNNLSKKNNISLENNQINIMTEEFSIESPTVSRQILFKVPKEILKSVPSNELTPLFCCSYINDFQLFDSLEEYYTNVSNPCGGDNIKGTYYLNNKYISATVHYHACLLQNDTVYAFDEDSFTILPFEYCGSKYVTNPTENDFGVNLQVLETPLSPIGETEEYYLYQAKVDVNIYLIPIIIVDPSDVNTLRQLNSTLGKTDINNTFSLLELATITDLSYESIDLNTIDTGIFRYLPNLKTLNMSKCSLDSIFPEIFSLVGLENLDLSYNNLKYLPNNFTQLTNLKNVYINDNQLSDLSIFNTMSTTTIYAQNQNIDYGILDISTVSNQYELDFSFLHDYKNITPSVSSTTGSISNDIILWPNTNNGQTVYFQFTNNEDFSGNVVIHLNKYTYLITQEGVIISYTPVDPSITVVNIPQYINNIEVKTIGELLFSNTNIVSVSIPNSVTTIMPRAFTACFSLVSVSIPSSVTSIGWSAFFGCKNLSSIDIPYGVTSIDYGTFWGCDSLISVTLPNSITSIGKPNSITYTSGFVFYGCSNLTSIKLSNNLTHIYQQCFYYCDKLTSIDIPETITFIASDAFRRCFSLTSIKIPYRVCLTVENLFHDCGNVNTLTITASSQEIDPSSSLQVLLGKWTTCANNLTLSNIGSITNKYFIIDGTTITLS